MSSIYPSTKISAPIRVVVADDNPSLRGSILRILHRHPDIQVVAQAGDGVEALHHVAEASPDILLLDIEMPAMNGLEVARRLSETGSNVKILILSAYDDRQFIQGVRSFGAAGYLLKESALNTLAEAIRRVARGETLFPDLAR
jgi:DNA-binding NarL/FixJ family response regulator